MSSEDAMNAAAEDFCQPKLHWGTPTARAVSSIQRRAFRAGWEACEAHLRMVYAQQIKLERERMARYDAQHECRGYDSETALVIT